MSQSVFCQNLILISAEISGDQMYAIPPSDPPDTEIGRYIWMRQLCDIDAGQVS